MTTLLGVAHSLAADPASPEAHRLAESAARNASLLAQMVRDLQQIARRSTMPARREMVEVIPALRETLTAPNVRIEGDASLVALVAPTDLATFVDAVVAGATGKRVSVHARLDGAQVRVTIRPAFPETALNVGLIRSLGEPLGPISIGVDGSVSVSLPSLRVAAPATPRWQPRG